MPIEIVLDQVEVKKNNIYVPVVAGRIGEIADLSPELKGALLQLAQKVAYIDDQGQTYYQALYDALYPPVGLESISAVYTQSGTVYPTTPLDDLKADLVVTGTYDDQTTATIPTSDYSLSGTLTVGTSTITVTSGGKTTTFTVNVTAEPTLSSISAVYTQSGIVLDTDTLDSLKSDLVVTATYSDSSTEVVDPDDYTLSGTLAAGTSTITVSYASKTTTFNVTVSGYVTDGLIMWLDGEKNSENGAHVSNLTTWVDQSGNGWDWTNDGATVNAKSLSFNGSTARLIRDYQSVPNNVKMMEIVFKQTAAGTSGSAAILTGFGNTYPGNIVGRLSGAQINFQIGTGTGNDKNAGVAVPQGLNSLISANSGGYINGNSAEVSTNGSGWQYSYPAIGLYRGSNGSNRDYPFTGEIYCIRLYSRILSESEILSNYNLDALRFGIGG